MKILIFLVSVFIFNYANDIFLNSEDLQQLKSNGYIIKKNKELKTGFIAFDVNRSINSVFDDIINLKNYPSLIQDVEKVKIYDKKDNIVKASIFISSFFIDFHNNIIHTIDKKNYTVRWILDKEFDADNYFSKMQGYWKLKNINGKTRIFYSNNLGFKSWIPTFLENYLFEKGLLESTSWLYPQKKDNNTNMEYIYHEEDNDN